MVELLDRPETNLISSDFNDHEQNGKAGSLRLQVIKVLECHDLVCTNNRGQQVRVSLEGVWRNNRVNERSTIHIINPRLESTSNKYVIDNKNGLLVVEPDNLYTCTLLASSLFCERKTWLNNVFLGQVGSNKAMTIGTLTHEVFQHAVRHRCVDTAKLIKFLDENLDDATIMLQIYSAETTLKEVRDEVITYITSIVEWVEKYMFNTSPNALENDDNIEVKITEVVDIEENIWSTKYGLKGKIDVTGRVRVHDKRIGKSEEKIIPLELKTGNPNLSSSHAAQVSLYSMMIEDRYAETNQGFVIYLKNKAAMHNVSLTSNTKRDLVNRRNTINRFMKDYSDGPDMLNQMRVCSNCERVQECLLMSKIYKPEYLEENSVMRMLNNEAMNHLTDEFIVFFKQHHEKLVHLMTKPGVPLGSQPINDVKVPSVGSFWTRSSQESEDCGLGFGKLQASQARGDFKYIIFKRHPEHKANFIEVPPPKILAALFNSTTTTTTSSIPKLRPTETINLSSDGESQPKPKKLKINDYFRPANKNGHEGTSLQVQTSTGNNNKPKLSPSTTCPTRPPPPKYKPKAFDSEVLGTTRSRFAISLDHDCQDMDSQNSSTAIAIGFINEIKEDFISMKIYEGNIDVKRTDLMYRIDKLEKRSNFDIERIVLIRLLENTSSCDNIRKFLTDYQNFKPEDDVDLNVHIVLNCHREIDSYDAVEQKFIVDAISTKNYYILNEKIEPTRGKVNGLIVETIGIIRRTLDKSIIIVARSIDSMIDLMRALRRKKIEFSLVDDGSSTNARYEFSGELIKVPNLTSLPLEKKFDIYIKQHEKAKIIFTTYAMSIGGLQFTRRRFDYCIAHECDKVELFLGLAPMFVSDKHILIDHRSDEGVDEQSDELTLGAHIRSRN